MEELKTKVLDTIKELNKIVGREFGSDIIPMCKVTYPLRNGRALGKASRTKMEIKLNPLLLEEFGETYIKEVVVHEYAHLVIHKLYPFGINVKRNKKVMPHGQEFKKVCRLLGIEGKATTKAFSDSKILKNNKLIVKCKCSEHYVSKRVYNNISKGIGYICKKCGTHIYCDSTLKKEA